MGYQQLLIVITTLFSCSGFALAPEKALNKKVGKYLTQGAIIGGQTGKGFSLLDLRRLDGGKSKIDRWVFEMGDSLSKPSVGKVPYYHVEIKEKPHLISIDLFQVHKSDINEEKLKKILKSSKNVKDASMFYDPIDGAIHIDIRLHKPVQVEVFEVFSKTKAGRLIMDIKAI